MLPISHPARDTDPLTSHLAADSIADSATGQRAACLDAYREDAMRGGSGLTDREVALATGISSSHKRCAELRRIVCIEPTGELRRDADTGRLGMVCRPSHAPSSQEDGARTRGSPRTATLGAGESIEVRDARGRLVATVRGIGDGLFMREARVEWAS